MTMRDDGLAARALQNDEFGENTTLWRGDLSPLDCEAVLSFFLCVRYLAAAVRGLLRSPTEINPLATNNASGQRSVVQRLHRLGRQPQAAKATLHALEVVDQARTARHGDAHRQHIDHHQMSDA